MSAHAGADASAQLEEGALLTRQDADALEPAGNKSTNDQSLSSGTTLAAAAETHDEPHEGLWDFAHA